MNTAGGGDAAEAGPVTPTPGICDRTQQVQDAILAALADVDDCAAVTVANLDSITDLQMNSKSIDSLKKGDFAGLTSLTILNLTRNTLTSLPEGIFAGLAELTELVLDQNQLATLPEAVFDGLVKLEDISLGGNSLTGLRDDEFSELTALEDLNLGFNELSSLPDEVFSDLTALTGLYLDNNNLDSLDAGLFSGLTALTTLQLDNNNLTSLDAGLFSDLTALTRLDLDNNPLGTLDAGLFSGLTALDTLDLYSSNLTSLPEGVFSDLTALTELYLDDNALSSLPEELFLGLASLRTLHMDGNTNTLPLTVTVEKVGTNQVRAKVLAGAPFAVDIPVTLVNGTLTGSVTELSVAAGEVYSEPVTMTRTAGTTAAATVDVDLTTQPTLPASHRGYEFVKATVNLPATILPDPTVDSVLGFSETAPRRAVPENSVAGVDVGAPVTSTPADSGDTLEYTLEGTDASSFDIVSTSGQIRTKSGVTYDYEAKSTYSVTVKASDGTDSATVDVTINLRDVDEQPDKPAKPTLAAVSGSATRLHASWTEPGLNGGPAITGYEVEYREGTSGSWVNVTHSGAGVTRTITGLRGNTEHQVRVRALNGETPSAWSDPSGAVSTNAATDAPMVRSVAVKSAPQPGDAYGWGETIVFTLTFNQEVRVTGQPQPTLAFNLGGSTREARYTGITDTDVDSDPRPRPRPEGVKVHFHYTVQPGDVDSNGIEVGALASAIDLGGARIQNAADLVDEDGHKVNGADAVLAHAALGRLPAHKVDGGTAQPPAGSGITIIDAFGNPLADNRLTLRENTRGRYGFKLNTRPTHTVWVVAIASDGDPDLQVLPTANATKAITPDEWETPFYMELRAAIDDDEEIGERVFLNWSSSQDPAYHDLILPDVVVVEDERADDAGALSVADAEASETVDETLDFVVTLDRTPSRDWEATVDYRTQDGTATVGSDYTLTSGTLTFAPGEDEKTVSVPIADDTVEDSGETLTLVLSNASGAGFASSGREAVGTIWNTETAATGAPTISGTPQVGETLTADTSGIADEDGLENVSFSYQWLADDTAIQGATNSTYTLIEADEGKAITVQVSFTDDAGNDESLTSAATDAVAAKPNSPATGAPTISGTAQVGETLTADTSGIADADGLENVTHSYQWLAGDSDISGATGSAYTLADADEGKTVKVRVSFTDDAGNDETLTSAATEAVAGNEEPVAREDAAAWSATMTVEWVYQGYGYYSSHAKKAGSLTPASFEVDGTTYTVKMVETQGWWTYIGVDRELPFDFVLELDGTRFASSDASFNSYSYGNIYRWEGTGLSLSDGDTVEVRLHRAIEDETAVNSPATGQPTISGTVQVGETLTADTSGIEDADGLDDAVFGYQWLANAIDISGATGSTYTLADADEGKAVTVQVSFTDDGGNDETLTSAATAAVSAAPNNPATGAPTISGTAQVGETLTADTSGIADEDGLDNADFSYQWLADDTDISGETGSAYTLADADEGNTVKVRVSFTDDGGNDETLTSAATATVEAAPNSPATGAPTISGTAQVGETLTADTTGIADADGLDAATFSYQWLADDTEVAGAAGSTYTLVEADEGKTVKVRVSFTDDAGNDETLTSAATEAVAGNEESAAPDEEPVAREDAAAWSATMTVEWVYQGYGYYSTDTKKAGSLTPASFEVDGTTYTVKMVETQGWWTYIGVDRELPFDFVLELDGTRFASGDASFNSYSYGNIYRWEGTGLSLSDGDTVEVRLHRAIEDETAVNSPATGQPTISGTAQVGETLTADTSGIEDADGLDNAAFTYRWLADNAAIAGATGSTHTLADADEGKAITVQVSFTDDAGNDETLTSAATDAVSAAPTPNNPSTGAPTISGTAQVGETLTADTSGIADEDGLDDVSFSYQWLADDADIAGATGSTYTLEEADEGKAITVQVSFTDDAGNDETLTSAATGAVATAEPSGPPARPTGLTAEVSHDSVTLTWDDPNDDSITGYVILRRDKDIHEEGTFETVESDTGSAGTTYTDDTVEAEKQYVYRIKAINADGLSEISSWVRAHTPAAPVPEPT